MWRRAAAIALSAGLMGGCGASTGLGLMLYRLPSVETLLAQRPRGATEVYDRNDSLVASLQNGENRKLVPLSDIHESAQHAVIASEDIRFYQHPGVDIWGVGRAVLTLGRAGGGSTLTQQLAKNLFLNFDRTPVRKLADMWLAIQLERTLSKEKILEMYLNQVYWGHGAYGIEAAANTYFGKKASKLTIGESAMLAGILPAPEYYSPFRRKELAIEIQQVVLKRMVDAGFITEAVAAAEAARPLRLAKPKPYAYRAPYFVSQVLAKLYARFGEDRVMRGGLKIRTTLDLRWQERAEELLRSRVGRYRRFHVSQGAIVAVEPRTGAVRVLVGGIDYGASQFNRATQAHRQPGSTFKPFVFLTAFSQNRSLYSTVYDGPTDFGGGYAPQNYDHRFRGVVTYERALTNSLNIPTVKVAQEVGLERVLELAHAAGIKSELPLNLSVALGSAEVTPLELASAYATFAADGEHAEPRLIERVEDQEGNVIEEYPAETDSVVSSVAVASLHQALQGVIRHGTGTAAALDRPAAGKTGTTSENRDTWFAGYTPDLASVVWLGNDDNSRLSSFATGGALAAPLWRDFMRSALAGLPPRPFSRSQPSAPRAVEPAAPASAEQPASGGAALPSAEPSMLPSAEPSVEVPPPDPAPSEAPADASTP